MRLQVFAPHTQQHRPVSEPVQRALEQHAADPRSLHLALHIDAFQFAVARFGVDIGKGVLPGVGVTRKPAARILGHHHEARSVADPTRDPFRGEARGQECVQVGFGIADGETLHEGLREAFLRKACEGGDVFQGCDAKRDRHRLLQAARRRSFKR